MLASTLSQKLFLIKVNSMKSSLEREELAGFRRSAVETQQQRESSKANEFVDFTSFQGLLHRFGINIMLTGYQRLTLARKSLAKQATTIKQLNGPRERRKEGSDP